MSHASLEPFCKLSREFYYLPCHWNMAYDHEAREYFIAFFRGQMDRGLMLAHRQAVAATPAPADVADIDARIERCRVQFNAFLDGILAYPHKLSRITLLTVDHLRDNLLRHAGFIDPYYEIKHHDNETVLGLLPEVCRDIDAQEDSARLQAVFRGALAGNVFDMGVPATAEKMLAKSLSFMETRDRLPARPWLVDDLDLILERFRQGPVYHKAVIFVDNAGADFILGMLPLARYLAMQGVEVVLVANEYATLNDMTVKDIQEIWGDIVAAEPSFGKLPISIVSSGTGEPLIDLSQVSPELNAAAEDADLVIVEGMGRALESNFYTRFNCDVIKIAMLKDQFVADRFEGKMYDVICRFEPMR